VVPPSHVVKTNMSTFALVLVSVGAVPEAHFTAAGHVTALAVPSAVNARVKPYAVPVVGMLEKVMLVIAAFNETANTLPEAQFRANTPDAIAGAVLVSFSPVIVGVVIAGLVAKTASPLPVSSVNAAAKFADVGVAKKVATLVPSPETPVEIGKPVHEVSVPLAGVPSIGVTSVGLVAKTASPLPVSSVKAAAKFAEEGVARKVATLVPSPLTPVEIGSPVHEVSVPLEGVPNAPDGAM